MRIPLFRNRNLFLFCCLPVLGFSSFAKGPSDFIRNEGQWPADFRFRAQTGAHRIWLQKQQIHYQLRRADLHPMAQAHAQRFGEITDSSSVIGHDYRVHFRGSNPVLPKETLPPSPVRYNFFIGTENQHRSNVAAFGEVQYENLYQGINLKIRNGDRFLKYDFELDEGTSAENIVMEFEGVAGLALEAGRLKIKTGIGVLEEHIPKAYQLVEGSAIEIGCHYVLDGNRVGFRFDKSPDPRYKTVIDPLLVFFTYSGAIDDNWANTAVSDSRGNSYTAGTVYGSSFPSTTGVIDRSYNGADGENAFLTYDIGILKFDSTGSQLLYCTFLGGSGADTPHSLAMDPDDHLLLLGSTASPNFPVTAGAFQTSFAGGPVEYPFGFRNGVVLPTYVLGSDLFITKINQNGTQILASTYLGGSGTDGLLTVYETLVTNYGDQFRSDLVCTPDGSVYIASNSHSLNFPTAFAYRNFRSGAMDGVVAKLNGSLSTLLWSTYFGGSGEDAFFSLKILPGNRLALCGGTTSLNLPVRQDAYQIDNNGGIDGFSAIFDAVTGYYLGSTYTGTSSYDMAFLIEGDPDGNIYLFGQTTGNMPRTTIFGNNEGGNFVQKLSGNLNSLIWSSTFGTTNRQPNLVPTGFMVDSCGRIFMAGWGGSVNYSGPGFTGGFTTGLPISDDALQPESRDKSDFYFLVLNNNASTMVYGSYLGADTRRGEHVDGGTSRFDRNGVITQAICGCRDDQGDYLRGSQDAYERDIRSENCNNGVMKLNLFDLKASMEWAGTLKCPATLTLTNNSQNGLTYIWNFGNGDSIVSSDRIISYTYRIPGKYWLSIKAINPKTCKYISIDGDSIEIPDPFPFPNYSRTDSFCVGDTLRPSFPFISDYPIWWVPQNFVSDPTSASPVVVPLGSTRYRIQIRNQDGCIREIPYEVRNRKLVLGIGIDKEFRPCEGITKVRFFSSRDSSDFYLWDFGRGETYTTTEVFKTFPGTGIFPVKLGGGKESCLENAFDTLKLNNLGISIQPRFESELKYSDCNIPSVQLRNLTTGTATGFQWEFGDGNISTEPDPLYRYAEPGVYRVILRAFLDGCIESASDEITVSEILVPNLITFNQDEKNETLQIGGLQPGWGLEIYNRWGKQLYRTDSYDNLWKPENLSEGSYFYLIRFPDGGYCRNWFQVVGK